MTEEQRAKRREYRKKNRHSILLYKRAYRKRNLAQARRYECEFGKSYRRKNREKIRKYSRIYNREYRKKNPEKQKIAARKYNQMNRTLVNTRRREWYLADPLFRFSAKIRCSIQKALLRSQKAPKKAAKTVKLLGCSFLQLRVYLESKFQPGMSWENYGFYGWHIDHIRPCASFNLADFKQQKQCFHYTNLQPLWARDNHRKGAKWPVAF